MGWHLMVSLLVVIGCAALVYGVWYPQPFERIVGVTRVVLLLAVVDAVCGPLLTLVLYDPQKAKWKWAIDMVLIASVQLSALAYGMGLIHGNRPVFLALEGDRFRLIQQDHLPETAVVQKDGPFALDWSAPRPIGVRMLGPKDPGYLDSIQQAAAGVHPAYRPERWVPYPDQIGVVRKAMRPADELRSRGAPKALKEFDAILRGAGLTEAEVGYLPLVSDFPTEWSVILSKSDGHILGVVAISGWPS